MVIDALERCRSRSATISAPSPSSSRRRRRPNSSHRRRAGVCTAFTRACRAPGCPPTAPRRRARSRSSVDRWSGRARPASASPSRRGHRLPRDRAPLRISDARSTSFSRATTIGTPTAGTPGFNPPRTPGYVGAGPPHHPFRSRQRGRCRRRSPQKYEQVSPSPRGGDSGLNCFFPTVVVSGRGPSPSSDQGESPAGRKGRIAGVIEGRTRPSAGPPGLDDDLFPTRNKLQASTDEPRDRRAPAGLPSDRGTLCPPGQALGCATSWILRRCFEAGRQGPD